MPFWGQERTTNEWSVLGRAALSEVEGGEGVDLEWKLDNNTWFTLVQGCVQVYVDSSAQRIIVSGGINNNCALEYFEVRIFSKVDPQSVRAYDVKQIDKVKFDSLVRRGLLVYSKS